jgi:ADP-ribose pyrophosphatase YjhB (NUDIX family)
VATLSEVVRSTKRIVAGAAAFQLEAGRKAETSTHSASAGPPLVARVFTTSEGDDAGETYAREVVEALTAIRRQLVDLEDLDDRVAVVGPDEAFIEKLREPLARALGGFELVDAATASAVLPRGDTEARAADAKQLLVVDSVDNMDGLERLVVICVGLDQVIDRGAGVLETRSRLYRAMTRAQLAVAVVNEALPGGWLEFLGRVELDDKMFDDAAERENRAETAADDVVGAVVEETLAPVATDSDATAVSKASAAPARGSDGAQQASPNNAVDAPVAKKAAADATTPSEAEPMKVLQSIWDASAVATASRGELRFLPFPHPLSKLAELRTLQGHSSDVRCGVRCTFVMICLRRRSMALPCFRTGGASCLRRATRRSRCSHARSKGIQ